MANLVGETIPDGTIMQPGETFQKTWRLKNNGTCTWNSSYKIVYWSGDLMGACSNTRLPDWSPLEKRWKSHFRSQHRQPTGIFPGFGNSGRNGELPFGVGQYDQPFYVQINVNDCMNPNYTVTNVTYNLVREPAFGCATNVWYYLHATISTNGPANGQVSMVAK